MTADEVESHIARLPGCYSNSAKVCRLGESFIVIRECGISFRSMIATLNSQSHNDQEQFKLEEWDWDDFSLWVMYDESSKVVGCYLLEYSSCSNRQHVTVFERLLNWVSW